MGSYNSKEDQIEKILNTVNLDVFGKRTFSVRRGRTASTAGPKSVVNGNFETYTFDWSAGYPNTRQLLHAYVLLLCQRYDVWGSLYQYPRTFLLGPLADSEGTIEPPINVADFDRIVEVNCKDSGVESISIAEIPPPSSPSKTVWCIIVGFSSDMPYPSNLMKKALGEDYTIKYVFHSVGDSDKGKSIGMAGQLLHQITSRQVLAPELLANGSTLGLDWDIQRIQKAVYLQKEPSVIPPNAEIQAKRSVHPGEITQERLASIYVGLQRHRTSIKVADSAPPKALEGLMSPLTGSHSVGDLDWNGTVDYESEEISDWESSDVEKIIAGAFSEKTAFDSGTDTEFYG